VARRRHIAGLTLAGDLEVGNLFPRVGDAERLAWMAICKRGRALVAQLMD